MESMLAAILVREAEDSVIEATISWLKPTLWLEVFLILSISRRRLLTARLKLLLNFPSSFALGVPDLVGQIPG